ncbi:hypothetical protein FSARC_2261 [Fusarium sarcochroum]|uniref:F-box domain-containing protein n=1 Tax=Fusarium sarcochroum TaxID=1208366 RepID=A0A8H4U6L7_9HYPO|nr:hypothetical protein FSARC_2261 [Fusarium sarcochroum]
MTSHDNSIEGLPNEILTSILSTFSTQELLPLAPISRQIYSVVTRLLHQRLLQAAPLPDNQLILECYHPSDQLYAPCLSCRYQNIVTRDGPAVDENAPELSDLRRLYASFRPVFPEESRIVRRSRRRPTETQPSDDAGDDTATQDINLDEGELFSQLCAVTSLVKQGPRSGLFISHVNIVDGVVRVFRNWLADMASKQDPSHTGSENIIWVDKHDNVGIRFSVAPAPSETMPLISGPDDDPPVHYKLVYEELLVRASNLLQAVEQSAVQEVGNSGKTLVIHGASM